MIAEVIFRLILALLSVGITVHLVNKVIEDYVDKKIYWTRKDFQAENRAIWDCIFELQSEVAALREELNK